MQAWWEDGPHGSSLADASSLMQAGAFLTPPHERDHEMWQAVRSILFAYAGLSRSRPLDWTLMFPCPIPSLPESAELIEIGVAAQAYIQAIIDVRVLQNLAQWVHRRLHQVLPISVVHSVISSTGYFTPIDALRATLTLSVTSEYGRDQRTHHLAIMLFAMSALPQVQTHA